MTSVDKRSLSKKFEFFNQMRTDKKKFDFFSVFRVYLNLNRFFYSKVDDIPKAFVILHRNNAEKRIC